MMMKKKKRQKIDITKLKLDVGRLKNLINLKKKVRIGKEPLWKELILEALSSHRGTASLYQIYAYIKPRLSSEYLKDYGPNDKWGKRPNFQHIVRSFLSNMVKDKSIERIKRGEYRII